MRKFAIFGVLLAFPLLTRASAALLWLGDSTGYDLTGSLQAFCLKDNNCYDTQGNWLSGPSSTPVTLSPSTNSVPLPQVAIVQVAPTVPVQPVIVGGSTPTVSVPAAVPSITLNGWVGTNDAYPRDFNLTTDQPIILESFKYHLQNTPLGYSLAEFHVFTGTTGVANSAVSTNFLRDWGFNICPSGEGVRCGASFMPPSAVYDGEVSTSSRLVKGMFSLGLFATNCIDSADLTKSCNLQGGATLSITSITYQIPGENVDRTWVSQ